MKLKKELQLFLLQPLGLYKPTFRDCLKKLKVGLDAVGPDLAKDPGGRVFLTKEHNFITMCSNDKGELVVNHVFADGRDVPEIYYDYLGKICSLVRRYKKGRVGDKNVVKETVVTQYSHKANLPKVVEQKPSKTKPYRVEIYKDDKGHVLKESIYTSDYKNFGKKNNTNSGYFTKQTPDFLLQNLSLW